MSQPYLASSRVCTIDGCERPMACAEMCNAHYARLVRHGDPLRGGPIKEYRRKGCSVEGCDEQRFRHRLCVEHFETASASGTLPRLRGKPVAGRVCEVGECSRPVKALNYCSLHHSRYVKHGGPLAFAPPRPRLKPWSDLKVASLRSAARAEWFGADVRTVALRDIRRLLRSDCVCGEPSTTLDHIIPLTRGGRHAIGNLSGMCARCNTAKSNMLWVEWRAGRVAVREKRRTRGPHPRLSRWPSNRACSIAGCGRPHAVRGWCQKHYDHWRHHGDPLVAKQPSAQRRPKPAAPLRKAAAPARRRDCSFPGCEKPQDGLGWCGMHLTRFRRHGDPSVVVKARVRRGPICTIEGCGLPHAGRGWCQKHYTRWQRTGDPLGVVRNMDHGGVCSVAGCQRPYKSSGYCNAHYQRNTKYGDPLGSPGTPRE